MNAETASSNRDETHSAPGGVLPIVLVYAGLSVIYILFSDLLVSRLFEDAITINIVSTLKGWGFVAVTSLLLYFLMSRLAGQIAGAVWREQHLQAEQRRTLTLLNAITHNTTDVIFIKDREGRYIVGNPALAELLGRPLEEIIGADDYALFPASLAKQLRADDRRIMAVGQTETYHEAIIAGDSTLPYLTTKGPLLIGDKVEGIFGIARDISPIKQTETDIRNTLSRTEEREAELEAVFQALPDLFFRIAGDGTILDYRAQSASNIYLPPEEFLGRRMQEVLPEPTGELFTRKLQEALTSAEIQVFDYSLTLGGENHRYEARLTRFMQREELICVVRNITEQYRAEAALRENEQRLRTLINATPDIICFKDGAGRWLEANEADLELFGLAGVDYRGKTDSELAEFTHDLYREAFLACEWSDEQAWQAGGLSRGQEAIPKIDGGRKVFDIIKVPLFESDGARKGLIVLGRDITERVAAELKITRATHEWTQAMDQFDDVIYLLDMERHLLRANKAFYEMTGLSPEQSVGRPIAELIHPQGEKELCPVCRAQESRAETVFTMEPGEFFNPSGRPMEVSLKLLRDDDGSASGMLMSLHDLSRTRQTEERLRLAASVFESTDEGVVITNAEGNILEVNRAFSDIQGYSREEVIGKNPRMFKSGHHDQSFYRDLWRALTETGHWSGELWNRRKNGELFPKWQTINRVLDSHGNLTHYIGIFSDITHIKRSKEQLDHMGHHDALTDLPNRLLLNERLEQAIKHAERHNTQLAVIFLDLDNFKHINDSLGHPVGDQLLQEVARKLVLAVRQDDTVARIGGDDFVLLLEDIGKPENAGLAAQKLAAVFAQSFQLEDQSIRTTASLGICICPQDGKDPATLLRNADAAMYRAKEEGRNTYQFYTEELTRNAFERVLLENNLRQAIEQGQLLLLYQLQKELQSGKIIGVEALVRWVHPELGMISPAKFIPMAEESGLIHPIGDWVLKTACHQGKRWLDKGIDFGRISVNIAGPQLQRGTLVNEVIAALKETGLPTHHLELEVTEGFIMQQAESAITQLQALRDLGLTLAIDDFGTGYSSLSYLKQLPIHKLKIDQSFVRDIPDDHNDMAIADAIIAMGRSLGLTVIAEGVETEAQAEFLKQAGCQEGQGYLYSKPVTAEAVEALILAQAG